MQHRNTKEVSAKFVTLDIVKYITKTADTGDDSFVAVRVLFCFETVSCSLRLASNSLTLLPQPLDAGITGVHHHSQPAMDLWLLVAVIYRWNCRLKPL